MSITHPLQHGTAQDNVPVRPRPSRFEASTTATGAAQEPFVRGLKNEDDGGEKKPPSVANLSAARLGHPLFAASSEGQYCDANPCSRCMAAGGCMRRRWMRLFCLSHRRCCFFLLPRLLFGPRSISYIVCSATGSFVSLMGLQRSAVEVITLLAMMLSMSPENSGPFRTGPLRSLSSVPNLIHYVRTRSGRKEAYTTSRRLPSPIRGSRTA